MVLHKKCSKKIKDKLFTDNRVIFKAIFFNLFDKRYNHLNLLENNRPKTIHGVLTEKHCWFLFAKYFSIKTLNTYVQIFQVPWIRGHFAQYIFQLKKSSRAVQRVSLFFIKIRDTISKLKSRNFQKTKSFGVWFFSYIFLPSSRKKTEKDFICWNAKKYTLLVIISTLLRLLYSINHFITLWRTAIYRLTSSGKLHKWQI